MLLCHLKLALFCSLLEVLIVVTDQLDPVLFLELLQLDRRDEYLFVDKAAKPSFFLRWCNGKFAEFS